MPTVHDLTADRFIDIPEVMDEFPTDDFVFIDADGDGFPAEIDPDDNDPTVIPDDPFGGFDFAINLLTTFLPAEFFNGTQAINEDTEVGIFQALAMINLVMERVFNVEADVDFDGPGPLPATTELIDAHLFVVPIGDPLALLIDGFEQLSRVRPDD